jgi:ribonuclease-3
MKNQKIEKYFSDKEILNHALTHKSWVNEHKKTRENNERLEFLGDAVLEFVVSKELYLKLPKKEEGYLTALRANLVNTVNLAKVANRLELGKVLFLSKGEEESGGRNNSSILADTVEAVIGGVFMDGGIKKAEKFIVEYILDDLDQKIKEPLKDSKSRLQEIVQAKGFMAPKYEVVSEEGPDHDKKFLIQVIIDKKPYGKGEGKNKGEAEQEAAKSALARFL